MYPTRLEQTATTSRGKGRVGRKWYFTNHKLRLMVLKLLRSCRILTICNNNRFRLRKVLIHFLWFATLLGSQCARQDAYNPGTQTHRRHRSTDRRATTVTG